MLYSTYETDKDGKRVRKDEKKILDQEQPKDKKPEAKKEAPKKEEKKEKKGKK